MASPQPTGHSALVNFLHEALPSPEHELALTRLDHRIRRGAGPAQRHGPIKLSMLDLFYYSALVSQEFDPTNA